MPQPTGLSFDSTSDRTLALAAVRYGLVSADVEVPEADIPRLSKICLPKISKVAGLVLLWHVCAELWLL